MAENAEVIKYRIVSMLKYFYGRITAEDVALLPFIF